MAKKTAPKKSAPAAKSLTKLAPVSTPVRNTPIPKAAAPARREITHEMIARRAYEIAFSPASRSPVENWLCAESELKAA